MSSKTLRTRSHSTWPAPPTCKHLSSETDGSVRPFSGCVAGPHGNCFEAAHGGYTTTEVCSDCKAKRTVVLNGAHSEVGSWGLSRERRISILRAQLEAARLVAVPISRSDGLSAWLDTDGTVILRGAPHTEEEAWATLPATWREAALMARRAIAALEEENQ
jgi:hypothetical protein